MELRQSMHNIVFILRLCGGFPPLKESKWYKPYWCFCGTVTIVCGLLFVFSNYYNVVFATDFDEIANSLYISIEHSAALVKIFSLLYFNGLMRQMFDVLDSKLFNTKIDSQKKYITATASTVRKNTNIFVTVTTLSLINYVVSPILLGARGTLPFPGYVPTAAKSTPYFQIIYACQAIVVCCGATLNITIDLLITSFMVIVCGQYDLLGDSFTNMYEIAIDKLKKDPNFNTAVVTGLDEKVDSHVYQDLIVNVKHHLQIMDFVAEIDRAFKWSLFAQFSCSSLVLCLNIYYLSTMKEMNSQASAVVSFTIVVLIQLFLYCWYGNKSMDFTDDIYMSNWQKCGAKIRKALCIIINRGQKPISITAGNFIPVRLETFISIVKTAYSALTLLQNMDVQL